MEENTCSVGPLSTKNDWTIDRIKSEILSTESDWKSDSGQSGFGAQSADCVWRSFSAAEF